ncbi:hypothetical protein MIND_00973800 [Mycena indigotica]|uniref:Peptidase C14 caspase domain-containing protein n=1 Tax=Mycena indigotica TaxID=2126181 RepID=A0A8H6SFH1_9AGAR|nr:uncharacterized protein MIND_00973800 [Mycena indigotica]KAF7297402.1 hypothetical protein MIND_00973800 [Mycena indigotica]
MCASLATSFIHYGSFPTSDSLAQTVSWAFIGIALEAHYISQSTTFRNNRLPMAPKLYALCIGIDEYASSKIRSLRGCVKDVNSLREVLLLRYPEAVIRTLTNKAATRRNVIETVTTDLIENGEISTDDAVLIYFAGYGQRLNATSRKVDALIPYDYSLDVPPIFDVTLHNLAQELIKKGSNVTIILDCSFSETMSLSSVRRIQDPSWPSHLADYRRENSSSDYGGFFTDAQAYVLIAASKKNLNCTESAAGGTFSQALMSTLRSSWPLSCREVAVLVQRSLANGRGSIPACHGQYLDRILFTAPRLLPIQKLRVFSTNVDLGGENDFYVVANRRDASVALNASTTGQGCVERLQGLVAEYGSPKASIKLAEAVPTLNAIAHFQHHLELGLAKTTVSWFARLFWLNAKPLPTSFVELYHYKGDDQRALVEVSPNILCEGVAYLEGVPNDHVFGLRITNPTEQAMYPYLVHFDTATYAIKVLYSSFSEDGKAKLLPPHSSLVFGRTPTMKSSSVRDAQPALRVVLDEARTERTAEIIKVILSEKPIDVGYMVQPSPMVSIVRDRAPGYQEIPGAWQTETVTLAVPANYCNGGKVSASSRGLWERLRAVVCRWSLL